MKLNVETSTYPTLSDAGKQVFKHFYKSLAINTAEWSVDITSCLEFGMREVKNLEWFQPPLAQEIAGKWNSITIVHGQILEPLSFSNKTTSPLLCQ